MSIQTAQIYSEVYSILNLLGESYIKKLPPNLFSMINEERSMNYNPKYTAELSLEKQNIDRKSLSMIALFHLNYWCNSEEEKNELKALFKENEDKHQKELREKYNPDNIFKKNIKEENIGKSIIQEQVSMVEYKETILKKIVNKIRNIFFKH